MCVCLCVCVCVCVSACVFSRYFPTVSGMITRHDGSLHLDKFYFNPIIWFSGCTAGYTQHSSHFKRLRGPPQEPCLSPPLPAALQYGRGSNPAEPRRKRCSIPNPTGGYGAYIPHLSVLNKRGGREGDGESVSDSIRVLQNSSYCTMLLRLIFLFIFM